MKTKLLLLPLLLLISIIGNSQLHAGFAAGSGSDKSLVVDLRFGYHAKYIVEYNQILSLNPANPCYFGGRIGKSIPISYNSYIIPVAGYYYSVFTGNDNGIYKGKDAVTVNKCVFSAGVVFVAGGYSLEVRQIDNTFQVTVGLWNILKNKK